MRVSEFNIKEVKQEKVNNMVDMIVSEFFKSGKESLVVVCIGTDKCIGDCLGPMVGTLLEQYGMDNVYGTLEYPIHAINIPIRLPEIKQQHKNSFIIAVDACLGAGDEIGNINLRDVPIRPGKGVGKTLESIGQMSLVGIVDNKDLEIDFVHRPIRMGFVWDLALKVTSVIVKAINIINEMQVSEVAFSKEEESI